MRILFCGTHNRQYPSSVSLGIFEIETKEWMSRTQQPNQHILEPNSQSTQKPVEGLSTTLLSEMYKVTIISGRGYKTKIAQQNSEKTNKPQPSRTSSLGVTSSILVF
jgi:hypothetical protein